MQQSSDESSLFSATPSFDASGSIAAFPTFAFSPHALHAINAASPRANVLVGVLEVDEPTVVRLARGPDAGAEVSVFRFVVGNETGTIARVTAWREVADAWSGMTDRPAVRRGDVVLLESKSLAFIEAMRSRAA